MNTHTTGNKSDQFFYEKEMHNHEDSGDILDRILPSKKTKEAFCQDYQEGVFQMLSQNHKVIGELFHNTVKGPTVINGHSIDYNLTTNYSYGSVRINNEVLEIFTWNYVKKTFTEKEGIYTIYTPENLQSYIQELLDMDFDSLKALSRKHDYTIPPGHSGAGEGLILIVKQVREQGGTITTRLLPTTHQDLKKIEITVTIPRQQ